MDDPDGRAAADAWADYGDTLGVSPDVTPEQEAWALSLIEERWLNVLSDLASARPTAGRLARQRGVAPEVARANAQAVIDDVREKWRPYFEALLPVPSSDPARPSVVAAAATAKLAELEAKLAEPL